MLIIRCTSKLFKELNTIPKPDVVSGDALGCWYANLLRFDRRKCVLFTNEATLYAFLVPGVKKAELQRLDILFTNNLKINLLYERLGEDAVDDLIAKYSDFCIAKTQSRSVLGSMNDYAYQYEGYIEALGGLKNTNILEVNKRINKSPMSALQYDNPGKKMREAMNKL